MIGHDLGESEGHFDAALQEKRSHAPHELERIPCIHFGEEARFEALFFANTTFSKTDQPTVSYLDQISGAQRDSISTDLGVNVPLRTGGT